ncbi:MAG: YkgJ family cysteine cluster protein [Rubrivivax sp.]|nr:YkgJ family cysteine cluster protein [Rubrivivax sp.]
MQPHRPNPENPCLQCGACCASFRVDFGRAELLSEGGHVPDGMAVDVSGHTCRMRGTDHALPRCAALVGQVGVQAACGIHEWRPSPCREFGLRAPHGQGDDACDAARRRHGLSPLSGGSRSAPAAH